MKKNIKKGILTLGTLAAAASPIAAVISCGETRNTIDWKDTDKFGGVDGSDFLQEIKHLGKTKQNAITVAKEQMMQLQYESESIRSITAEIDQFKYQNWQTEMDNKKLGHDKDDVVKEQSDYAGSDDDIKKGYEDKIKTIESSIKDNDDKIKKIKGFITILENVTSKLDLTKEFLTDNENAVKEFYEKDYKSSDYPDVYKPLSTIKDEKTNIVNDAYRQFYPQFTTRKDGDKEWPSELAKNYGNAATFSQAIDYLVTQTISDKAFNSYKFEINKDFTVEQKIWAQYIDTDAFKFLVADSANGITGSQSSSEIADDIKLITDDKDKIEDNILAINRGDTIGPDAGKKKVVASVLSSKEIFLGSKSPDHRMPKEAIEQLGKVVKYQHLLIKATQGDTPEDVWTIKGEDLVKLMKFVQYKDGANTEIEQGVTFLGDDNLFDDTSGDDANKFTDFVLKAISGNSEGTLTVQGSLGIKSEIEYLKAMVPGFSLGALAITEGTGSVQTRIKQIHLSVLITNLKDALTKEVEKEYPGYNGAKPDAAGLDTTDNQIEKTITALGDDKVKTIFGKVFEEFFKDKKDLVYQIGTTDKYLVISQFGIHIIKRVSYNDPDSIRDALKEDIKNMAKDDSSPSSTSLIAELTQKFTDTKIIQILLGTKEYQDALKEKLIEYNKDKTEEVDKVEIGDITDVIESVNKLKDKTDVDGAIGDKLENWLVSKIDADLRQIDNALTLSDIYEWAQAAQTNSENVIAKAQGSTGGTK